MHLGAIGVELLLSQATNRTRSGERSEPSHLEISMTAKTEKAVNYTAEQTVALIEAYKAGEPVAALAEKFGKTARSVIAKLSREGVYQKKEYVSKTGEKPVKKDTVADAIGKVLGLSEGEIESLAKANKTALRKIFDALANSQPL